MSIFAEVATRKVVLTDGVDCPQTMGVYCGSGGTLVVVLWNDGLNRPPGTPEIQTTFVGTNPGQWLPISISKKVSGPADAVGFTL